MRLALEAGEGERASARRFWPGEGAPTASLDAWFEADDCPSCADDFASVAPPALEPDILATSSNSQEVKEVSTT